MSGGGPIDAGRVVRTWWPLAASWALIGIELPVLSAVVARMPEPKLNLAAYGGVCFPLALLIESPIIMLLAASTALSRDRPSYERLRRFMHRAGAALTLFHAAVALTPLYGVVAEGILGVPAEVRAPARLGLVLFLPWTWSIAYRRFHQGVLIRFGHSRAVGIGTGVRMAAHWCVLLGGYATRALPGVAVACTAMSVGVMAEALYVGLRVRPVLRALPAHDLEAPPVTAASFLRFYTPLALTQFLNLAVQPIGAAAISRMPQALDSLAAWPPLEGLTFFLQSPGVAFNEVVIALAALPGGIAALRSFARRLSLAAWTAVALIALTPLAGAWFVGVSGLPPALADLAARGLLLALPLPALTAWQSYYQGALVAGHRTRGVVEGDAVFLVVAAVLLSAGAAWDGATALVVASASFSLAFIAQILWLRTRAAPVIAGFNRLS